MKTLEHKEIALASEVYTVIAWVEVVAKWDGVPFATDLGQSPKFIDTLVPKAVVWIAGKDTAGAKKYTKTMDPDVKPKVFVIRSTTPLEDARKRILLKHRT